jgi:exosortase
MRLALAAVLLACMAWLYADLGMGLVMQWVTSPEASYGAIVAAVAAMVFWERREKILDFQSDSQSSTGGPLLICMGLLAYLAGIFAADLFTTRASFVIVTGGLIWFLAGTRPAAAAFAPLTFLLLAIPLPELVVTSLTSSLQTVAARTAEATLVPAGIPVYRDGNVLELPATTLQIVEACSGLRSVVSLASLGVLLAWASSGTPLRGALVIASTLPIAVMTNGFRVAATGAAAEAWGPAMLKDPWHSLAGWLTFLVSLGALWAVRQAVVTDRRDREPSQAEAIAA